MFSKERLRIAKDLRGLTTHASFAEKLGCSISKVKQLLDTEHSITLDEQNKLCEVLDLPRSFFLEDDIVPQATDEIFYRSVARIKAGHKKTNEAYTLLAMKINQYLMSKMNLPVFNRPKIEINEVLDSQRYVENLAIELRASWGLGIQPINNMISLCELKGIRVFRLPLEVKEIDAFSFFDENSGCPIIFLNTFKSAERVRFDCAHELGHILLHTHDKKEKDNRDLEAEADRFASELLMPTEGFFSTAPRYLSLDSLMGLKKIWRTSLKAVNYRAHKLELISDWVYRSHSVQINAMNYHINEPEETHRDESVMLPKIISLLISQPNFDKYQMFEEIGISENDFNALTFNLLSKLETKKPNFYFVP